MRIINPAISAGGAGSQMQQNIRPMMTRVGLGNQRMMPLAAAQTLRLTNPQNVWPPLETLISSMSRLICSQKALFAHLISFVFPIAIGGDGGDGSGSVCRST